MSKLYDALLRDNGSIPDLDPVALLGEQPAAVQPPQPPAAPILQAPLQVDLPEAPVVLGHAEPPDAAAPFRAVHMRLPQYSPALPFGEHHWQANEQYRILRTK